MAYSAIVVVTSFVAAPLGILGGLLIGIVVDLCASSFLYYIGQSVMGAPARLNEFKKSFIAFFWPVMSFGFLIWIATMLLGFALAQNPKREVIQMCVWAAAALFFNAVPEVIYQKGHTGGLAIVTESTQFIQKHWIEWFIPNLVFGAVFYGVIVLVGEVPFAILLTPVVMGALIFITATFRGHLFYALDSTSPYQLKMRYRR